MSSSKYIKGFNQFHNINEQDVVAPTPTDPQPTPDKKVKRRQVLDKTELKRGENTVTRKTIGKFKDGKLVTSVTTAKGKGEDGKRVNKRKRRNWGTDEDGRPMQID